MQILRQVIVLFMALATTNAFAQVPKSMSYQALLTDSSGNPINGAVDIEIGLWDDPTLTNPANLLYTERHDSVDAVEGVVVLVIGRGLPPGCPAQPCIGTSGGISVLFDGPVWLELFVNGETMSPRVELLSAPYAFHSLQADTISSLGLESCPLGEIVVSNGAGGLECGASSTTRHLSIPSSAFTPKDSNDGWTGNTSGTARYFDESILLQSYLFAPVQLPHEATVTGFRCGGQDPATDVKLRFTLRRNQPQIANVDMAVVESTFATTGFQFMTTSTVVSPQIDNSTFNYYVAASPVFFTVGPCTGCSVGFCRVSYTEGAP
jgi:hypothetical protein